MGKCKIENCSQLGCFEVQILDKPVRLCGKHAANWVVKKQKPPLKSFKKYIKKLFKRRKHEKRT